MSVRSAQSVTVDFCTSNPATGAAVNADSLPTGVLVLNGTDNAATVTITNVSTGIYKAAVTTPTLAIGDYVQIRIQAIVSTITANGVIWTDTNDFSNDASGRVLLQPAQAGVTIPTVTTVTNQLTAAAIATGVWQDTTSGDFTVASSIGKCLFTGNHVPGDTAGGLLVNNAAVSIAAFVVAGTTSFNNIGQTTTVALGATAPAGWLNAAAFSPVPGTWGGLARYGDVARVGFRSLGTVWSVAGGVNNVAAPTVTQHGTPGTTTYIYQVTALNAAGQTLGYAGIVGNGVASNALGAATLNGTNYNIVTCAAVLGATGYTFWKWTGSAWGTVSINQAGVTYNDQGGSISAGSIPLANTTSTGSDSSAGTVSSPFATVAHAISVASPGDIIQMGAMWFCIGTGNINMPDGVGLVGAGMDVTNVVADTALASGAIVKPASYALASDFTVTSTAAYPGSTNIFSVPLGSHSSAGQTPIIGATIRNVKTVGDSDGIYVNQQSALTRYQVIDCLFYSKYDAANHLLSNSTGVNGNLIEYANCEFRGMGPSTCNAGKVARSVSFAAGSGTINIVGGSFEATGINDGGGGYVSAISNLSSSTTAIFNVYGAQCNVSVPAGSTQSVPFDIMTTNGTVNLFGNSSYNPAHNEIEGTGAINLISPPMSNTADSPAEMAGLAILSGISGTQGTAQGGTANTITLFAGDTSPTGTYVGQSIRLVTGTGAGQVAVITAYDGATQIATIKCTATGGNWVTTPDDTTTYLIFGIPSGGGTVDANVVSNNGHAQQTDANGLPIVSPSNIPPVVQAVVPPTPTVTPG